MSVKAAIGRTLLAICLSVAMVPSIAFANPQEVPESAANNNSSVQKTEEVVAADASKDSQNVEQTGNVSSKQPQNTVSAQPANNQASNQPEESTNAAKNTEDAQDKPLTASDEGEGKTATAGGQTTIYRLYNKVTSEHLYTPDLNEAKTLYAMAGDWGFEGIGWIAPNSGTPVYRLNNNSLVQHLYTTDKNEIKVLTSKYGWIMDYDGKPLFYSDKSLPGALPVYRLYNEKLHSVHHLTTSKNEYDVLGTKYGWDREGIALYAKSQGVPYDSTRWYPQPMFDLTVTATCDGKAVKGNIINGKTYVFLPSNATAANTKLTISDSSFGGKVTVTGKGASQTLASGGTIALSSLGVNLSSGSADVKVTASSFPGTVQMVIMKSSGLKTMHITSDDPAKAGRAFVDASPDHTAKAAATMVLVEPNGTATYGTSAENDGITIKGRGNATWGLTDKKPYQIKLEKKTDLLGTGNKNNKAKTWVLLSNPFDPTLLRNTVAYDLALELGLLVSPESEPIDLYYDGEYRGQYQLCEKVEIAQGRVDIDDLDDANEAANPGVDLKTLPVVQTTNRFGSTVQYVKGMNNPANISGGYLIECDTAYYEKETGWFRCGPDVYVIKSPETPSREEAVYVSELWLEAYDCLENGGTNPKTGKTIGDYFDLDSLAKVYLLNETIKNVDSYFSSTYYYKPAGEEKFYAGPVWDYDGSWGSIVPGGPTIGVPPAYWGYYSGNRGLGGAAMKSQVLRECAANIYTNQLYPIIQKILLGDASAQGKFLSSLAGYAQKIAPSQAMDQTLWGLNVHDNMIDPFPTWNQNVSYAKDWMNWRSDWLLQQMPLWIQPAFKVAFENYERDGIEYWPVFDATYYRNVMKARGVAFASDAAAFNHFMSTGIKQGIQASRNFNYATYKAKNPDVARVFGNDIAAYYRHYCTYGFFERRTAV